MGLEPTKFGRQLSNSPKSGNRDGNSAEDQYKSLNPNDSELAGLFTLINSHDSKDSSLKLNAGKTLTEQTYVPTADVFFEHMVENLAERLPVSVTDEELAKASKKTTPASLETKKAIARQILKVYAYRPDVIDKVLASPNFHMYVSTGDTSAKGGVTHTEIIDTTESVRAKWGPIPLPWHKKKTERHLEVSIAFDDKPTGFGLRSERDGYEAIVHEFTHAIHNLNATGIEEDPTFKAIHQHFLEKLPAALKADGLNDAPPITDPFWGKSTIMPGVKNYAFILHDEFYPEVTNAFSEKPEALFQASPELFNLLAEKLGFASSANAKA